MKKPVDTSRRAFLNRSALLTGAAVGSAALPVSAAAVGSDKEAAARKTTRPAPLFDPTLENYPGYSADTGSAGNREVAEASPRLLDTQLLI